MRNYEIYKTPEEAYAAHVEYCKDHGKAVDYECKKCGAKCNTGTTPCLLQWLYMEAELKPCPCCGGKAYKHIFGEGIYWVECSECQNGTGVSYCESEAIEKWNRRTK